MVNFPLSKIIFISTLTTFVYIARYSGIASTKSYEIGVKKIQNIFRVLSQVNINPACQNGQIQSNLVFTDQDIASANSSIKLLQAMVPGNPLTNLMLGYTKTGAQADQLAYGKAMIPAVAPWLVLFIISILGCCGCYCNWCCMYCFEDYFINSCRCCKKPRNKNKKCHTG